MIHDSGTNMAAHSKLKSNGAETKPPANSDRLLFLLENDNRSLLILGGFFPSGEWKAEKWQEQPTIPSWT
jgi:hypothetical protein